jgi:hypothetical protein
MQQKFHFSFGLALLTLLTGVLHPTFVDAYQIQIDSVTAKTMRRTLDIEVKGSAQLPAGTILVLSFGKASQRALSIDLVVEKGRFQGAISVRGLVLPGQYDVRLSLSGEQRQWVEKALRKQAIKSVSAEKKFRIGSESDERPARERLRQWIIRANGALTSLAMTMERLVTWHWTSIQNKPGALKSHQQKLSAYRDYLTDRSRSSFYESAKVARMDIALYQRRLVFDPFESSSAQLKVLLDLIDSRARSHLRLLEQCAAGKKAPAPNLSPYLAIQRALIAHLKLATAKVLANWDLGPAAIPEKGQLKDGLYKSLNGHFELAVPKDWIVTPSQSQGVTRLSVVPKKKSGAFVQVSILEAMEGDLKTMTGIVGWENRQSYQRIKLSELEGRSGVRHEFRATTKTSSNKAVAIRVLELRILRKDRRQLTFIALAPVNDFPKYKDIFEKLAGSLTVK